jgi:hypothetical protein
VKRTLIRKVSKKMARQKVKERELSQQLLTKCNGLCMKCGQLPDWRGLSKHELIFRSRGGNPLDEDNTILICGKCHSEYHGIKERINMEAKEIKWCPQHGYPLPCDKCGLGLFEAGKQAGIKEVLDGLEDYLAFNMPMMWEQLKTSSSWQAKVKEWKGENK